MWFSEVSDCAENSSRSPSPPFLESSVNNILARFEDRTRPSSQNLSETSDIDVLDTRTSDQRNSNDVSGSSDSGSDFDVPTAVQNSIISPTIGNSATFGENHSPALDIQSGDYRPPIYVAQSVQGALSTTYTEDPGGSQEPNGTSSFMSDDSLAETELDSFMPGAPPDIHGKPKRKLDASSSKGVSDEQGYNLADDVRAVEGNGDMHFGRVFVPQAQHNSVLSRMMQDQSESKISPMLTRYSSVECRDEQNSLSVRLHFPMGPNTHTIDVQVRRDANMDQIIGYGLLCYAKKKLQPLLDAGVPEHAREARLSTRGWSLRLVEDGDVDEDYPALDRSIVVGSFGEDEFAICAVDGIQVSTPDEPLGLEQGELGGISSPPSSDAQLQVTVPQTRQQIRMHVAPTMFASEAASLICDRLQLGERENYTFAFQSGKAVPGYAMVAPLLGRNDIILVDAASVHIPDTTIEQPRYRTAMDLISRYKVRYCLQVVQCCAQKSALAAAARPCYHTGWQLDLHHVRAC